MSHPKLFAIHNLFQDKLHYTHALGGLACPSVAIVRDDIPYTEFGDISLIATKDMINPNKVAVFDADVYSSRFPSVFYEVNKRELSRIEERFSAVFQETGDSFPTRELQDRVKKDGTEGVFKTLQDRSAIKIAFLREIGRNPRLPMKDPSLNHNGLSDHPLIRNWFKKQKDHNFSFEDPVTLELGRLMIRVFEENNHREATRKAEIYVRVKKLDFETEYKEIFKILMDSDMDKMKATPDGYIPTFYTFNQIQDDIQKINAGSKVFDYRKFNEQQEQILKKHASDFHNWLFDAGCKLPIDPYFYHETAGGNSIKKELTLENIVRSLRGGIIDQENFSYGPGQIRSHIAKRFNSLRDVKDEAHRLVSNDEFEIEKKNLNSIFIEIADSLAPFYKFDSNKFGFLGEVVSNIKDYTKKGSLPDFKNVPECIFEEIDNYLAQLRSAKTEYFEAKVQKAVTLDEFAGAIIPHNASRETIAILEAHGVPYVTYKDRDPLARLKALSKFSELSLGEVTHLPRHNMSKESDFEFNR